MNRENIKAYWCQCDNFGDKLVQEYLFPEYDVSWETQMFAKVVATGSIIQDLTTLNPIARYSVGYFFPIYVFGTGVDNKVFGREPNWALIRKLKIYALRGEKTFDFLNQVDKSLDTDSLVLGDSGLLVGLMKEKLNTGTKKYDLGIVPHFVDLKDKRFVELRKNNPNSIIISPTLDVNTFLEVLTQCRYCISTAMHPLIACDALHIPNMWAYLPDANQIDMSYKFLDYYSVFDKSPQPYVLDKEGISENIVDVISQTYNMDWKLIDRKVVELKECRNRMIEDMKKDEFKDIVINSIVNVGRSVKKLEEEYVEK